MLNVAIANHAQDPENKKKKPVHYACLAPQLGAHFAKHDCIMRRLH